MTECIAQIALSFYKSKPVSVSFDAPEMSSDGGAILLRQIDDQLHLSAWFAAEIPEEREASKTTHTRREQVRQRLYQIALGYEDCNDADTLRCDPLLQTVCDRDPQGPQGLSSQPTLSRFENAADMQTIKRLLEQFEQRWVDALAADTEVVVLDIDSTDDPTHGAQQLSFFHGYYDHHIYHPLLIFDGQGELVSAILRPGNAHTARGAGAVLERVIRRIKRRFPHAQIVVRGDAGFGIGRLLEQFDRLDAELGGIAYLLGLAKNSALLRLAEPALKAAAASFEQRRYKVREFSTISYAAATWSRPRQVVVKAEHTEKGANPRFVVTNLDEFEPDLLYHAYCQRGQCENLIKDFKNALKADRLSCSRFVANFLRLLEHAAAYRLMLALRRAAQALRSELGLQQFDTIRLRLLKVAALVHQSVRRILVQLPRAFPCAALFRSLALCTSGAGVT
jgi:Transposase DDE domain group 1